ncbi:MAG: LysM peptidoglycan-binding domain-containing protein [Streptosporangiales bacterium]|nr:LysM peptidoglycan-binding domain-containing protein [Streptosporangiales bacterium]
MGATGSYRKRSAVSGVRLTRRGRAVVVVVVLGLLLGAFWLGTHQASTASTGGQDTARTATVPPGGTLWEIAVRADPDTDPRIAVERIMNLNGLTSPIVQPGERVTLPPSP